MKTINKTTHNRVQGPTRSG